MGKQANMRDIPKPKSEGEKFDGAGSDIDTEHKIIEQLEIKIRRPIELSDVDSLKGFRTKKMLYHGHYTKGTRILGAAGESLIPEQKLKVMSDPYTTDTRQAFTDLAMTDPVVAPALLFRVGAFFEDGFDLRFIPASQYDPMTGQPLTPEQQQQNAQLDGTSFLPHLLTLQTWKKDRGIEQVAKDLEAVSIVQGKAAALISPGILDLQSGQLPALVEIITADDLGDPIIDVGSTRKLVACKLEMEDKEIARADELVYLVRGIRGLRREAKFHGTSPMEPILQISKAIKRHYHLDAPLAMIAAYITRQLLKVKSNDGDVTELKTRVETFMSELFKASTWAVAMPEWYDGVDAIQPKVDWPMFDGIEQKLANTELAQLGVPKSSQNREQGLNRDIATIQAIQFVRFIRKPSENIIKEVLETQLFNPLLAKLANQNLSDIPVRIEIVRKIPDGGDIDTLYDQNTQNKNADLNSGNIMQNQAQSPFGASGSMTVRENKDGSFTVEPASRSPVS
jgi:hypothetical protein